MLKDRLKDARIMRSMTQSELAEKIGIVKSTIAGYETGRSEPDMKKLAQLMDALDVDANYLLQDEMRLYNNIRNTLDADELRLLSKYRVLTPHGKRVVNLILEEEYLHHMDLKKAIEDSDPSSNGVETQIDSPDCGEVE